MLLKSQRSKVTNTHSVKKDNLTCKIKEPKGQRVNKLFCYLEQILIIVSVHLKIFNLEYFQNDLWVLKTSTGLPYRLGLVRQ